MTVLLILKQMSHLKIVLHVLINKSNLNSLANQGK